MSDETFELSIERRIAAPPERVFQVWTERTAEWWASKPWETEIVAQDLRPGGRTAMIMRGPDQETPLMEGVFLEVTPNRRIVFTNAFTEGWIPQQPFMVAFFEFEPDGEGTLYRAGARHWDAASREGHLQMNFHAGWMQVVDQLAALAEAG